MKKFIYIAMLSLITVVTVSSCTEEEIVPTQNTGNTNGGGGVIDPIVK